VKIATIASVNYNMHVFKKIKMQPNSSKRTKNNKRRALIIALVLLLIIALGLFWWLNSREKPYTFINYNPPTKQEKAAGDEKKKELAQESNNQTQSSSSNTQASSSKAQAEVVITSAAQFDQAQTPNDPSDDIIDIRAYVPNRYEKGVCTITLSKGSLTVVKEAPAYPDTSYTICTNPLIKRSELPEPGDWQVVVAYSSDAAYGSATQIIRGVK